MTIRFGNVVFEGPYDDPAPLDDRSGVYAVVRRGTLLGGGTLIDVGESATVRSRVVGHDRQDCWRRNGGAGIGFAAHYCDAAARMRIEATLRAQYNPPCGDR